MSVSIHDVEKIASLSRLVLTPEEAEKFAGQLNLILDYVSTLNQLDTSDVEPMSHPNEIINVFREDVIEPSLSVEDALKNAPQKTGNYFKVPKVVSK